MTGTGSGYHSCIAIATNSMRGDIIECMSHTGWKVRLEMKSERITLRLVTGVKNQAPAGGSQAGNHTS